jgi:hypothetical protein
MRIARTCFVLFALLMTLGVAAAQSPDYPPTLTIRNPEPAAAAQFGYAVAMVGTNVLVGAPFDDGAATDAGAAYLFDGSTGALLQTFRSPNPAAGDWFGIAVAAVGGNVLVGALGDDTGAVDAGAAYLFDGKTGALVRAFQKPTPAEADWFGGAVAAAGENVLIGAPLDDLGGVDAGAAYLFDGKSGALLQTFRNPTPDKDDWFGVALGVNGSRVIVGAMLDDAAGADAGAVHLFDLASGALVKSLPGAAAGDWFGVAVAPFGDGFLVGAPFRDAGARDAGEVTQISAAGEILRTYPNPEPAEGAQFGRALAAVGAHFAVGAPGPAEGGAGGLAWLLHPSDAPVKLRRQQTGAPGDQFGFTVAAAAGQIALGSPTADAGEPNSGAVYLYRSP